MHAYGSLHYNATAYTQEHVIDFYEPPVIQTIFYKNIFWNPVQLLIDAQLGIPFALLFFSVIFP